MSHRSRWLAGTCVGAITAGLLVSSTVTLTRDGGGDVSDGRNVSASATPSPSAPDPPAAPE
ncbi:hypothetical protein, partial [Streptomyces sparsus]